jgi:dTDP-glucose 4,6-dehydratase
MKNVMTPRVEKDTAEIVSRSADDLRRIGEHDVVLTGATGFVGHWLSLSFLSARKALDLPGKLYVVSRNPGNFQESLDHAGLAEGCVAIATDVRTLTARDLPSEALIVHAATPARASLNSENPLEMIDIIVEGQKNMLEIAVQSRAARFLFLSSGAVYGRQPRSERRLGESWEGAPLVSEVSKAYHEAKRLAELLGNVVCANRDISFTSARLFAFLAPFLPLDEHFAAGNFIKNAAMGEPIAISSGGGSVRSYQYGTDMTVWLWALLARGRRMGAYNVGSDEEVLIKNLAERIAEQSISGSKVEIRGVDTEDNVSRYVPDIGLAQHELGVSNIVGLTEAISRTLQWVSES